MRETDITYQDKLNELMLDILHPNSKNLSFICVEGKSDIKLFRKLFNQCTCKVEKIPGGNPKVEQCVEFLLRKHLLVVGIRDADFVLLNDEEYSKRNVFLTDYHDIEITMLAQEPVLKALMYEFTNHSEDLHLEVRNDIMKSIEMVGYLKWLNNRENLELCFKSSFKEFISFKNCTFDFSNYLTRVFLKSPNAVIKDEAVIAAKIDNLKTKNPDLLQLTNGHDLLNTFATYFQKLPDKAITSEENIAVALRIKFDREHFENTTLYSNLKKWSQENSTELFASV